VKCSPLGIEWGEDRRRKEIWRSSGWKSLPNQMMLDHPLLKAEEVLRFRHPSHHLTVRMPFFLFAVDTWQNTSVVQAIPYCAPGLLHTWRRIALFFAS
jgi:hypothetical protein